MAKKKMIERDNTVAWAGHLTKFPQPGKELLWKPGDKFHYSKEELAFLPPAHREAIVRLMMTRMPGKLPDDDAWVDKLTTPQINKYLNLWRPCEGVVPADDALNMGVLDAIIHKFRFPLEVACDMSVDFVCHKRGTKVGFQPVPIVEPSAESDTYYGIIDWDMHLRYMFAHDKAWTFKWFSLTALANWIIACMRRTTQVYIALEKLQGEKLRSIKNNPLYHVYDDDKNPFGFNPKPNEQ